MSANVRLEEYVEPAVIASVVSAVVVVTVVLFVAVVRPLVWNMSGRYELYVAGKAIGATGLVQEIGGRYQFAMIGPEGLGARNDRCTAEKGQVSESRQ